jgi:hypothetical protein
MAETFFILEKKSADHGQFSNIGLDKSHPHLYLGRNVKGGDVLIMSSIGTYVPGMHVQINGATLASASKYFIDHTGTQLSLPLGCAAPSAAPLPAGITINKEIMVVLTDVRIAGNFREAAGTIFYIPDDAFPKGTPAPIIACIKEGKEILVRTDVPFDDLERYRTFLNQAFGFAKLHNVRLPGVVPGTNRITADHTGPKPIGYVSQDTLNQAMRP